MSLKEKYEGYTWIKVKRYQRDLTQSLEQQYADLERHHLEETTFLINKVRELAAEIDRLSEQR
jgi:hypothetical protein